METAPIRYAGIIALTTVLAACDDDGGGGGNSSYIDRGSVPDQDVEVREDNAEEVSEQSVKTGDNILGDGTVSAGIGSTPDAKMPSSQSGPTLVGSTLGALDRFGPDGEKGLTTRASGSESYECEGGGSMNVDYQYDGEDYYSSGSVVSIQYDNCRDGQDVLFRGGYEMTFENDFESNSDTDSTAEYSVTYDNFRATDGGDLIWEFDGDMGITWGSKTSDTELDGAESYYWIVAGDELYMADPEGTHRLRNFDMTYRFEASGSSSYPAYKFSYDYILSSTDLGGTVNVVTETPFYRLTEQSQVSEGLIWIYAGSSEDQSQPHIKLYPSGNSENPVYFEADVDGDGNYEKEGPSSALDGDLLF